MWLHVYLQQFSTLGKICLNSKLLHLHHEAHKQVIPWEHPAAIAQDLTVISSILNPELEKHLSVWSIKWQRKTVNHRHMGLKLIGTTDTARIQALLIGTNSMQEWLHWLTCTSPSQAKYSWLVAAMQVCHCISVFFFVECLSYWKKGFRSFV